MSETDAATTVRHDAAHHRFVVEQDGEAAELLYQVEPGRLILLHTEVPHALGGHGIGGRLVRAAIGWATAEKLTVVPWCPFARQWLEGHPDVTAVVTVDWDTLPRA